MSTLNPTHGTKVTDLNASKIQEGAGPVASDSLAAESANAGGGFADNRNSGPLGVAGGNSTFANTNTSGASRLDPASDAESRMAQEDWAKEKKFGAAGTSYPDGADGQSKSLAVTNTTGSYTTGGSTSSAGTAPGYVNSQSVVASGPKGKNLTEGGFESNDKSNASFNAEIGSKNDPGRFAEQEMFRENTKSGGLAGVPTQQGGIGENEYEVLSGDVSS